MKVFCKQLERISKEKVWLPQVMLEHKIFSLSRKESILARQAMFKNKNVTYENLVESS